jgi:hypothetical protein
MPSGRPADSEYAPFYAGYVALVPETDIVRALEAQRQEIERLAGSVSLERERHRYADGKWTIREVIGHLVDGERVFGHRAFCISRGEQAPLPPFDENLYVRESGYDAVPLGELARELVSVRGANLAALARLNQAAWERRGTVSGRPVSVRALAYVMVGHVRHHAAVLRERYGVS